MHILIATDAWHPQVNGVVRSLESMASAARLLGAKVDFLTPEGLFSVPMPTYPEIRLSLITPGMAARRIAALQPDHIHIATEGPLGLAVRRACLRSQRRFTTSYHTRYPEYIAARAPVPQSWSYAYLRRFHNASHGTMVSTGMLARELEHRGFKNLMHWSRGVDHGLFRPRDLPKFEFPGPIFLYAGRVAVEKNIEAFLALGLPGTKVVAGDGPARARLEAAYPQVKFLGNQSSAQLAAIYCRADVFVFPSRTDTFGIVLLEAMASGLPVAAYPVPGPLDVVGGSGAGSLQEDLRAACMQALEIPRDAALGHAAKFTWEASARQFLDNAQAVIAATPALQPKRAIFSSAASRSKRDSASSA